MMLVKPRKSGMMSCCLRARDINTILSRIRVLNSDLPTLSWSRDENWWSLVNIWDSRGSDLHQKYILIKLSKNIWTFWVQSSPALSRSWSRRWCRPGCPPPGTPRTTCPQCWWRRWRAWSGRRWSDICTHYHRKHHTEIWWNIFVNYFQSRIKSMVDFKIAYFHKKYMKKFN